MAPDVTSASAAKPTGQAVQAFLRFLGLADEKAVDECLQRQRQRSHRKAQPLRAIQEPEEQSPPTNASQGRQVPAQQVQKAKKAVEGMTSEMLHSQLQMVYSQYTAKAGKQRMDSAVFLHLLADAHLLTNRFGVLEGQEVFDAAEIKEQTGKKQKVTGLTFNGFVDALHRLAAVKFTKLTDLEEAYRRLLSHCIIPYVQRGPSDTALVGLFNSLDVHNKMSEHYLAEMLSVYDGVLKKIFAWYASLPYLTGHVAWSHFQHTHKGIMAGHILMFLTDFKVVPGLLSVRQMTEILQRHAAQANRSDLQYPEMLEVLCECAVLLRQQVQRKLAGPWVNLTELNSLKRYLKAQAMPSLQEAYALPNSPQHISTITQGMQNVQLTQNSTPSPPTSAWPQFVPQHSRLAQGSPQQSSMTQNSATHSSLTQSSTAQSSGSLDSGHLDPAQHGQCSPGRVQNKEHLLDTMAQGLLQQRQQTIADAVQIAGHNAGTISMAQAPIWQRRQQESTSAAQRHSSSDRRPHQRRQYASAQAALQHSNGAAQRQRPEWSNVTSSRRVDRLEESGDWMHPQVQHLREEATTEEAAVQEQACRKHLAGREASKRRLLQHRMERLSSDPRMPARLALHPSAAACTLTPPYALLDAAAGTPTTALNMDGDGWAPCVDLVTLKPLLPKQTAGNGPSLLLSGSWGELPMHSLQRIPLDSLTSSKLGKRSRESAWAENTLCQLSEFESRLPTVLNSWSIESERQQWRQAVSFSSQLCAADAA